ncbi:MAG: CbtB domain-containing protein [Pseudomonadota bacterium]
MNDKVRIAALAQPAATAVSSRPLHLLSVMLLGGLMIYMAGFLGTAEVHNAAHDMRHSIGFPCH